MLTAKRKILWIFASSEEGFAPRNRLLHRLFGIGVNVLGAVHEPSEWGNACVRCLLHNPQGCLAVRLALTGSVRGGTAWSRAGMIHMDVYQILP